MTKILIKKQLMEVFSWIYQDKKTGKNRDKKGLLLYVFFYVFLFGFLAVIFYNMAASLCGPLVEDGFGWLYIALMGIVGMSLGVFGSVFNTFASLYQAKDNESAAFTASSDTKYIDRTSFWSLCNGTYV